MMIGIQMILSMDWVHLYIYKILLYYKLIRRQENIGELFSNLLQCC